MLKERPPGWVQQRRQEWLEFRHSNDKLTGNNDLRREKMRKALEPSESPKKKGAADSA
jgi:hypothetical protein